MGRKSSTPKEPEKAKKKGPPDPYKPEFCQDIIDYFTITEPYKQVEKFVSYYPPEKGSNAEHGGVKSKAFEIVATAPPHLNAWARSKGIHRQRIWDWIKTKPEFKEAVEKCRDMRAELIKDNGLNGLYDSRFAQMAAMNMKEIGWSMKAETKTSVSVNDTNLNDVWKERKKKIETEKKNQENTDGK